MCEGEREHPNRQRNVAPTKPAGVDEHMSCASTGDRIWPGG